MIARVKLLIPVLLAAMLTPLLSGSVLAVGYHNSSVTPQSAYDAFLAGFDAADPVGGLFLNSDTFSDTFASGVLIHPNFVLTAGHAALANENDESSFFDEYLFVLGVNTSTEATEFKYADEVFLNPGYNGVESGVDLALLYFEDGFTSVAPAEMYQDDVQAGDISTIVGYGRSGTPATGIGPLDGVKRASENIVEFVDSPQSGYFEYFFTQPGFTNFMALGGQGLPGDSGGGWFIQSGGDFYLADITSGGAQEPRYGGLTSAYEVNLASTWINETIASKQIPEPSSLFLASFAGMLICTRRRRG